MLSYAADDPDIIATGWVPDIRPYLKNCDCMLVALEFGGGTRLKVLEAFAAGCPVVSTAKGAEGLLVASGTHLMIGNTNFELVDRTVQVCTNPALSAALIDNARGLVATMYDWPVVHMKIENALLGLGLGSGLRREAPGRDN